MNAFSNLPLPVDPTIAGVILFSSMLLIVGAGILRRPGAAVGHRGGDGGAPGVPVVVLAVGSGDLRRRDRAAPARRSHPAAAGTAQLDANVPHRGRCRVEAVFRFTRSRGLDARRVLLPTGALVGAIIAVTLPLQQTLTDPTASFGTRPSRSSPSPGWCSGSSPASSAAGSSRCCAHWRPPCRRRLMTTRFRRPLLRRLAYGWPVHAQPVAVAPRWPTPPSTSCTPSTSKPARIE